MKKSDYLDLIKCGFLSQYGGFVKSYWSNEEREKYHKISDINKKMLLQFEAKLDYNNLIILFPVSLGYGQTCLFGENRADSFPIDHCTNIVYIRDFLDKKGIKYKDGVSMTHDKYRQFSIGMLIIQDGVAYANTINANPFNVSIVDNDSEYCSEIKISKEDSKNLVLDNKEIIFSGFLVKKIINNKN